MIAAVYARKSTDQSDRADEAKSVTRQVEHATAYAIRKGWTVDPAHVHVDDGISGAEFVKRPGFLRLMTSLKPRPPFQVLVMAEESRLGREQIETAYALKQFTDAGVRVFFYLEDRERTLDTAMDKVMLSLGNFAAEMEREKAGQRVHDTMMRKAKALQVTGGVVYGYDNVEVLGPPGPDGLARRAHVVRRINATEAAVLRWLFQAYAAGRGLKSLAADLNRDGAPPPKPRRRGAVPAWSPLTIRDMLDRPLYRGEVVWNRLQKIDRGGSTRARRVRPEAEWLRLDAPEFRIIPEPPWQTAQARLAGARLTKPTGWTRGAVARPALLHGLAKCTICGGGSTRRTRAHGSPGRRQPRRLMYACGVRASRGRAVCTNRVELREDLVDRAILRALAAVLTRQTLDAAIEQALTDLRSQRATGQDRRLALERELSLLVARQDRLAGAIADGEAMAPLLARLKAEETGKGRS